MVEKKGPWFDETIRSKEALSKIHVADPYADLKYVLDAISLTKKELNGF